MARSKDDEGLSARQRLADENEQLRTSVEALLEENSLLLRQRDRLRENVSGLSRELRAAHAGLSRPEDGSNPSGPVSAARGEGREALEAAFEELQVLSEELEVANSTLLQTNQDLDARVAQRTRELEEMNAVLRSTEASLQAVADLVPDLLWRTDAKGRVDWFSQRWLDHTGHAPGDSRGMRWFDAIQPRDRDATETSWGIAVASGKPFEHEHRLRGANGEFRWFLVRAEPLRDGGRITSWYAAGTDIHDRRLAMEALRQSELRFRTLIEGMPQLVWRAVSGGRWTWSSPQWSRYTGQDEAGALGMGWLNAFHPADRDTARDSWMRAQESGELELEGRIFHAAENRYRHFRTRALPVRDNAGRILEWIGTSTDVDDMLQLQQHQGILVAELQHRTRNLMAVVQAVTASTVRDASSLEDFERRIRDRLAALARVQALLSKREGSTRISFDMLLRDELSAHVELPCATGQVRLDGPAGITLRSATVQTFALALHELATNAVKYGALSNENGRLTVNWGLRQGDADGPLLWVDWRERDLSNRPTPKPSKDGGGYGRELIERALPYQLGARTSFALEPDGVHCTIEMTVPDEQTIMEKVDG